MYTARIDSFNRNKVDVFNAITGAYACSFYANVGNGCITNVHVQGQYVSLTHSDGTIVVYDADNRSFVRMIN